MIDDPTLREYVFNCKTKFVSKNVREDIGKGIISQYQRKMVLLVPEESDGRTRFLMAWMPEVVTEYHELALEIGAPIHGPSRVSIHCGRDAVSEKPYLTIMSKGIEETFVKFPEGTLVKVKALSTNEESEADNAADSSEGNYDVVT